MATLTLSAGGGCASGGDGALDPVPEVGDARGVGQLGDSLDSAVSWFCGDGVVDDNEACDDGDRDDGDGCDASCRFEPGFVCSEGTPSLCTPICGDGWVVGTEACDDANAIPGDGCLSCAVEPGFACEHLEGGSVCAPVCGDGIVVARAGEGCDDNNANPGDGCSATCQPEPGFCCDPSTGYCLEWRDFEVVDAALAIPDGTYDGGLGSMACVEVEVGAPGICNHGLVHHVEVEVGIDHPRVGELTMKLVSPSGIVTTLVSVPGFAELEDGHPERMGAVAALTADDPIRFDPFQPGAVDAELMGFGLGAGEPVCQLDGRCSFLPNPGAGEGQAGLDDFAGAPAGGPWRLCVGDNAAGWDGVIRSVALTYRAL